MKKIARFHYITQGDLPGNSHVDLVKKALDGDVDWIQFRAKDLYVQTWKKQALQIKELCDSYHARLIINDNVELAKEIGADGVHLGQKDMNPTQAREYLGSDFIIGATVHSEAEYKALAKEDVDYIGLGPFRETSTKQDPAPVISLEGIKSIVLIASGDHPVLIAIGGIGLDDVNDLLDVGVHGVAVASAVNTSYDPAMIAGEFLNLIERKVGSYV